MAGAPGTTENNAAQCSDLLQGTLGLRNCQEEPGRRMGLLRFADKLPRAGRKDGHRVEVELGTHRKNRPLDAVL